MRLLKYIFFILLIIPVLNCQPEAKVKTKEEAKHIFAKFYVRYLQAEKELKAEASFKQGDTISTARSIVLQEANFEKNKMEIQNLGKSYGIRYSFRKAAPYSTQYDFEFGNEQIGIHKHTVQMEPITAFYIKEEIVKKTAGINLIWEGQALSKDQELVLLFTDEQNKAFPITVSGPTPSNSIALSSEKIASLSPGKGRLMVIKKQLIKTKETNFTKITEMEFYSNNLDIEIVK